ncbi:TPA: flavin reductase [Escherichia coli]|nr:flavin reductase [Escherichia coli]
MKLFGISSRDSGMDAMFYIQASTKQQASFIFDFLATRLYAHCQLIEPLNETIIPSLSRTTLSLQPWSQNSQTRTSEMQMVTHGLTLSGAVMVEHSRQIVDFCDNLGLRLDAPTGKPGWTELINADCEQLNSPRLYPVLIQPGTEGQFQIYVPAPAVIDADTVIASVIDECFSDVTSYCLAGTPFPMTEKPVIRMEAHLSDAHTRVFELTFISYNLALSATVYDKNLRQVLMLCEDFGVTLQGRAGASCHAYMRNEYRRLAHVGVYSRSGAENDVRAYSSDKEETLIRQLMTQATAGSALIPARHGKQFNGVLMNANPSSATTGFIYLSPEFPQGQFMMTAEVVKSSCTPRGISYIETVDGYRFIVTAYDTKAMHSLTEFLDV